MSLYYLQKVLYDLNRNPQLQVTYMESADLVLSQYSLTEQERTALIEPDIGLLYVLGVNGQILMHFAALHKIEWDDYLQAMREGIDKYGPVRDGVYAMTGAGKNFTKNSEVHSD